jgi:Zn-dependent metalloprotease
MYRLHRVPRGRTVWRAAGAMAVGLIALALYRMPASAQQPGRGRVTITSASTADLRDWSPRIDSLRRSGELRLRVRRNDPLLTGRTHERYDQYHRGVRVYGADVAEQLNGGQVVSAFGQLYEGIDIETSPAIEADRAREIVEARAGVELGRAPELVILPRDANATYVLAWRVRAATGRDVREYFVDARDGTIAFEYSDLKTQTQSAVGRGQGVLGDSKKISVSPTAGQFVTTDRLRPPAINTYDMRGDYLRTIRYLNKAIQLTANDLASDADNTWTDGATVDAHVYAGWTYDYFFKRFSRRGLDNQDLPLISLVHPARRADFFQLFPVVPDFYLNAFYYGEGIMVYGEGLPPGVTPGGQTVDFFSAALDVVAHELTHGVTEYTSNLIYQHESGALNESFSDIIGTSVEYYFQQPGSGNLRADYLIGEDVFRPGGIRSHENPQAYGDPDHYSRRFTGAEDNGGVHINSGIPNHVFYLAVEGGTNRTSGLSVQGVGAANREQIERAFYRAFTQMLPAGATFAVARAATIQAARDLFGANSNAERAITQAWTAAGVN